MSLDWLLKLTVGDKIAVYETRHNNNRWYVATIADQEIVKDTKTGYKIFIHYDSWSKKYDQWIPIDSKIKPIHSITPYHDYPKEGGSCYKFGWTQPKFNDCSICNSCKRKCCDTCFLIQIYSLNESKFINMCKDCVTFTYYQQLYQITKTIYNTSFRYKYIYKEPMEMSILALIVNYAFEHIICQNRLKQCGSSIALKNIGQKMLFKCIKENDCLSVMKTLIACTKCVGYGYYNLSTKKCRVVHKNMKCCDDCGDLVCYNCIKLKCDNCDAYDHLCDKCYIDCGCIGKEKKHFCGKCYYDFHWKLCNECNEYLQHKQRYKCLKCNSIICVDCKDYYGCKENEKNQIKYCSACYRKGHLECDLRYSKKIHGYMTVNMDEKSKSKSISKSKSKSKSNKRVKGSRLNNRRTNKSLRKKREISIRKNRDRKLKVYTLGVQA